VSGPSLFHQRVVQTRPGIRIASRRNERHGIIVAAVASYSALPEPMLARSGTLPTSGDYAYEVKWDGFRAVVSTEGPLRVRSRRGWDMTEQVTFLAELPVRAVLNGELVALDDDGKPDFPQLCACVLMRRTTAPL
jgi:ATP-dependent DNA ligase